MDIRRLAAAVLALAAAAATASTQEPAAPPPAGDPKPAEKKDAAKETEVPDLEVIVTGFPEDPRATSLPLFVVDGKWFEEHQVSSVADGLRQVPGVTVSRGGTPGAAASVFLRGAASNQVLVLQDGMPLNDPTLGSQFNFFDLDALNLDRMEVLRGSYGALYGSSAIGGVVNLVSRRGEGPGTFRASAEGGSFLTHRETLSGSGGDAKGDWSFGLAETGTDGPHDRQAFESRSFAGLFGAPVAGDGRAEVAVRWVSSTAEDPFDFGSPLPKDANIRRERDLMAVGLSVEKPFGKQVTARVRGSVTKSDSTFRNGNDTTPGGAPEFTSTNQATTSFLGASARTVLLDDEKGRRELSFVAGGDAKEEASLGFSDSSFGGGLGLDRSIRNQGAYLLARGRMGPLSLEGGGRYDHHSQAGGEWSPQGGARVDVDATSSVLKANAGEGFRAPTPAEFTDPFVGNPNLGPERSRSLDAGVEQKIGDRVTVEATWFRLRTRDLIAFDPVSGILQNLNRTRCVGTELALNAKPTDGLVLRAAWTRQRPRNDDTGDRLPNRPDEFASAGAEWTRGAWTFTADAYWQGAVDDLGQTGPDQELRDHAGRRVVANLGVRWKATDKATFFARVENVLNDEYVETPSAPKGLPVGLFAGVSLEF
jgi:vitamin B12 transporter